MREVDTDLPFVPIWCAQIQISPKIGVSKSDMSLLLFNKTAFSSFWQAGKMAVKSTYGRRERGRQDHCMACLKTKASSLHYLVHKDQHHQVQ